MHFNMLSGSVKFILTAVVIFSLSACSTLARKDAVPPSAYPNVKINSLSNIRYNPTKTQDLEAIIQEIELKQAKSKNKEMNKTVNYLSISGGGDNGAFGAGLLVGWTQYGNRPKFGLVTGVSTGALIAPFAFLGSDYDYILKYVYTEVKPSDIYNEKDIINGVFGDGLADTTPLYRLISKYVDEKLLEKIAYEYEENNRWLIIGTTNIDLGTPSLWNMGKIASARTPESLELFRKILLASASIPGAFPPVLFDATTDDGKHYNEMHVDGGATAQVFLYPSALSNMAEKSNVAISSNRQAYIIRNARLDPEWENTQRKTFSIVARAIAQLLQAQGMGDLTRIYMVTQKDNIGFNLAYIPPSFDYEHKQEFDQDYMRALFALSESMAIAGYKWDHYPPGFKEAVDKSVEKHGVIDINTTSREK